MKKTYHAFESCLSIASHEVVWAERGVKCQEDSGDENTKDQSTRVVITRTFFFQKAKITSGD